MKAVRLLQIVLLIAAVSYLVLLHDMNEYSVILPFLIPVPPALLIVAVLALGMLLGWLPGLPRRIARGRELRALRKRVAALDGEGTPDVGRPMLGRPVILKRATVEPETTADRRMLKPDAS